MTELFLSFLMDSRCRSPDVFGLISTLTFMLRSLVLLGHFLISLGTDQHLGAGLIRDETWKKLLKSNALEP